MWLQVLGLDAAAVVLDLHDHIRALLAQADADPGLGVVCDSAWAALTIRFRKTCASPSSLPSTRGTSSQLQHPLDARGPARRLGPCPAPVQRLAQVHRHARLRAHPGEQLDVLDDALEPIRPLRWRPCRHPAAPRAPPAGLPWSRFSSARRRWFRLVLTKPSGLLISLAMPEASRPSASSRWDCASRASSFARSSISWRSRALAASSSFVRSATALGQVLLRRRLWRDRSHFSPARAPSGAPRCCRRACAGSAGAG